MKAIRIFQCACLAGFLGIGVQRGFADLSAVFYQARSAYDAGRWEEAAAGYESLIAADSGTAEVWFNLGNVRYRQGDLGRAALAYRRASRKAPRDPDIRFNFQHAQRVAQAAPPAESKILRGIRILADSEWELLAGIGYGLFFFLLCAHSLWKPLRSAIRPALTVCAALTLIGATGRGIGWWADQTPEGVIVSPEGVEARFAPLSTAGVHYQLPPATVVRLLGVSGEWRQIRMDRAIGWIPSESVEPVVERSPGFLASRRKS